MIHTYVPFAPKKHEGDLGWCYNNFMKLLKDDDWACFLDHDACFLTRDWYNQLEEIIKLHPDIGLFFTYTNRVNQTQQIPNHIDRESHDIRYHRKIAAKIATDKRHDVRLIPKSTGWMSGVVILISKQTWKKTNGFESGFYGVDNNIHAACNKNNIPVGLMEGVYVYHWYRGDGVKYDGKVTRVKQ